MAMDAKDNISILNVFYDGSNSQILRRCISYRIRYINGVRLLLLYDFKRKSGLVLELSRQRFYVFTEGFARYRILTRSNTSSGFIFSCIPYDVEAMKVWMRGDCIPRDSTSFNISLTASGQPHYNRLF